METMHTATPWKVDENTQLPLAIIQDNEDGYGVLELGTHYEDTPSQVKIDAAFIVKAVNCHDELLEALKVAVVLLEASYLDHAETANGAAIWTDLEKARAAINKAEVN